MKNDQRIEYATRDSILKLLSSQEVASVSTAETAVEISHGEEYLDLEHLDLGVQRAQGKGKGVPLRQMLSRKAVHENTWAKILIQLKGVARAEAHPR
jgi:hypothetical protein